MSDENSPNGPPDAAVPGDGSSAFRDEGDDAVPSPEFVAEALRRLARQLGRDSDGLLETAGLVEARGYDQGTRAALTELAEVYEERAGTWAGIARALRRVSP